MTQPSPATFSRLRAFFWPVEQYELKKVIPMLLMFFFITFNYTILRDLKDTLVITAPGSGAEIIPFIKVWCVVPTAILFMLVYAKLSNILSRQALFYCTITPFLLFFALFAFVLYPERDALHPVESVLFLEQHLPEGLMGLIALYRNWTFAIFYVLAELWGSIMLSLAFWGFANQITRVSEAKRFYSLFGLGGNSAPFFSGLFLLYVASLKGDAPADIDAWESTLQILLSVVVILGILIIACYAWVNRYVLTDPRFYDANEPAQVKKSKPTMSLKESFFYLIKSKYLGCIALLVLTYGISMNIIEVSWKHQVHLQYPNPNDYASFMGYFSTFTGLTSLLFILFAGGNIIRYFGWNIAAQITPIVLLITGVAFFAFAIFRNDLTGLSDLIGLTPLMLAVVIGAIQNILSKSTKYALFDPTKEMAYIPLDEEAKVKGKAAIDVVVARVGKSSGSFLQQGLLLFVGSLQALTPYLAGLLFFTISLWLVAARALGRQFAKLQPDAFSRRKPNDQDAVLGTSAIN